MLKLLINSLAKEFYQQHAGFFLVGIYILFGIVEPSQLIGYQKALLLAGISSPVGLAIVFASWFLYSLKAHFFIKQRLVQAQYNFVGETTALLKNTQLKLWLRLYLVILAPILIYVFLLIGLSFGYQLYLSVVSILIVFSALVFGLSWLTYQSLTFGFLKQERQITHFGFKVKKPFFSWPLFHLFNEQPLMLLMCKLLSLVFFKGMLWMFIDVGNDIRVLLVAMLASILCHATLVFTLLKFETEYLNFSKSLEISVYKRLQNWLLVFTIILIPEWIFLISASHFELYSIVNGFVFGLAGLIFLLTLLYIVKLNMDNYLKWLLFFFFISMWLILGHYYLLFSLALLVTCTIYYVMMFNKTDLKGIE
ncbi:hypothetical protein [Pedobacter paludis]|uniref:Uncharacterized protein n=1 Tax=Pedobacter paludis TaxID=2203212 RepID=A0A317F543_9SPHI|nr:hypothetical protein [Pedobacter paludis]PWS33443.1 hypothetical protein DF947_02120 [Pedobacter paludis]